MDDCHPMRYALDMQLSERDIAHIGLTAARGLFGDDLVERVDVVVGLDSSDQPAYFFRFLIDRDRDPRRFAAHHGELSVKIRDELIDRGDWVYPFIRVVGRDDWAKISA